MPGSDNAASVPVRTWHLDRWGSFMAERNPVHHILLKRPSVMVNSQLCLGSDQRLNLVKCTFGDLQNAHTEHTHARARTCSLSRYFQASPSRSHDHTDRRLYGLRIILLFIVQAFPKVHIGWVRMSSNTSFWTIFRSPELPSGPEVLNLPCFAKLLLLLSILWQRFPSTFGGCVTSFISGS